MAGQENRTSLQDLMEMKKLAGFRLIAGRNGLSNIVESCSILDYEYDPELRSRFHFTHFKPNMLVLTSFLYAKEHEYLVEIAVKKLIAAGVSALAVKNIYHISIPASVLRYADSRNFPIFLIDDTALFIEPIILSIHEGIRLHNEISHHQVLIDRLLRTLLSEKDKLSLISSLYPVIQNRVTAVYFRNANLDNSSDWNALYSAARSLPAAMVYQYRQGLLLLCESDFSDELCAQSDIQTCLAPLSVLLGSSTCGISNLHRPMNLDHAITEAIYASLTAHPEQQVLFRSIGCFQLLFPLCRDSRARAFAHTILNPIQDFDIQSGSQLMETIRAVVEENFNLLSASERLCIHSNTVRQRLERIHVLTKLDFKKPQDAEQLSIALKIDLCAQWLDAFGDSFFL